MGSSQGNSSQRQEALPSTLRATTACVLETRRGVGLSLGRQGAMRAMDVEVVGTGLQDEGATLFVNVWDERMGVIAAKSATRMQAR